MLGTFFLITAPGASASEGREIEYEKINRLLSTVSQSKSPLIQSEIKLEILSNEISYDDVKVSIVNNKQTLQEIPVDVISGTIELPVFEDDLAEQLALKLNQDKESLVVNLNASIKSPSSTTIPYRDLFIVIEDFNQFIRKMAGAMLSLLQRLILSSSSLTNPRPLRSRRITKITNSKRIQTVPLKSKCHQV